MPNTQIRSCFNVAELETENRMFISIEKQQHPEDYSHQIYSNKITTELPDFTPCSADEEDRDEPYILPAEFKLSENDEKRLKQELSHLSFDTVLKVCSFCKYNVNETISMASQMFVPELMSNSAKKTFTANIALEREARLTKNRAYKKFYMVNKFRKAVDNQTLVNFYYTEKNKLCGNWRLEQEPVETLAERQHMEKVMKSNNISIIRLKPIVTAKKGKLRANAAATRNLISFRRHVQQFKRYSKEECESRTVSLENCCNEKKSEISSGVSPMSNLVTRLESSSTTSDSLSAKSDSSSSPLENIEQPKTDWMLRIIEVCQSVVVNNKTTCLHEPIKAKKGYNERRIEEQRDGDERKDHMRQARKAPKRFDDDYFYY